jgi:hypothetical protein
MNKLPKTIGNYDCPRILSLLQLAQTQSKRTLSAWSIAYAKELLLPIYEKSFPLDTRPRDALENSLGWLEGHVSFADAKETNNLAHNAATDAEGFPAAQAAARAIAHASLTIHVSSHCMGIAFYGAAAIAYDHAGLLATKEAYLELAESAWSEMEARLRAIAIESEQTPATINRDFWNSRIH